MDRVLIVHYGEIGLKKANKDYFVKKLIRQIKIRFEKKLRKTFRVSHVLGRIVVPFSSIDDEKAYFDILSKICGITSFKFCFVEGLDLDVLSSSVVEKIKKLDTSAVSSFKVKVKRSMILSMKSFEIERKIGALLIESGFNKKVDLSNPDFIIDIEFFNGNSYFSFKTYRGLGGFPANSQGKLVALMSSGIDSPVAAFRMIRRGARVIFVHFHGYPYTDMEEMNQVKEIVEILSAYQFDTKLYLVPFGEIQKKISLNASVPPKVRTVIYRRLMLRIAEFIAKKIKAKGLITGDNFGQVASQTPDNIFAIHDVSSIPLFQPLIGYDKEEIIKLAEEIGTFDVSKLPCKDSCSMFMPKTPELSANVFDLLEYEKVLPINDWISDSLNSAELLDFS